MPGPIDPITNRGRSVVEYSSATLLAMRADFLRRELSRVKRFVGVCTQDDTFDGDFTVEQNLLIAAEYFRPRPERLRARVAELLDRFDLAPYARHRPEALSGGYRRRRGLARDATSL